ncbi:MAG TPA: N-acetylglucosamine-6-phosphate deacetylase [Acetobacteraceae bacterium]
MIALGAPRIFDGEDWHDEAVVLIDGDRITGILAEPPPGVPLDAWPEGTFLAPGYIDLQVNGGGGVMFNDAVTPDRLRAIATAHARAGTTAILPTLISGARPLLADAIAAVRAAIEAGVPGIAGLHLEGPFINTIRRGIHPAASVAAMTADDAVRLRAPFPLLVTLAPEQVAAELVQELVRAGTTVFAGHTDATHAQAAAGLEAGIAGFTHLFNAMSQITPREPGAVGAALSDDRCWAGIIADLHHVHPANIRLAYDRLGPDRLFLVSDAMATAGSDLGWFTLGGETIRLQGGRLTDQAGTLAGAHLTMAEAVRNLVALGIHTDDALRMASATPAACARLDDRGRIGVGMRADLVALDENLNVLATFQGGQPVQ